MPEFKIGDIVRLKSGGPAMTVTALMNGDNPKFSAETIERFVAKLKKHNAKVERLRIREVVVKKLKLRVPRSTIRD
jgi:hypothetical protein